jgi:hypothetical protein
MRNERVRLTASFGRNTDLGSSPAAGSPAGAEALIWTAAFAAAAILGLAAVAVAPLAAYVILIALFGLPHVLAEMRYCDERFSGVTPRIALALIGGLLAALAMVRLLGTYGAASPYLTGPLELILGGALALAASIFMRRFRWLGLAIATAVVFGALYFPLPTFLIWAWLHNLTPLGFIAEALKGRARTHALLALSVPFFILPAFVALGGLVWIGDVLFAHDPATAPSALGAGLKPLQAFLPPMKLDDAVPLFQAAVLAQVMHYVAVIALLPRLLTDGRARPGRLVPWPRWRLFYLVLAAAGLVSFAVYAADFVEARSAYALAATLHSWIELPVFLMALGGGFTARRIRRSPTPH